MLLTSQVERESDLFARRRDRMTALVAELRERTAQVAAGGGEKSVERHRSRGKLTARERIDLLVDPHTAFLELSALAAWDVYEGQAPSACIVTGIGMVEGRECVVVANDATVKGGTYSADGQEALRAQETPSRTARASTSSTRGPSCLSRPRSFPIATISDGSSTRRECRRRGSHRSRW
jgi:3-methylcrotonyl-CoA carboxylase beta subunit/propionyl-CoA carboxylase